MNPTGTLRVSQSYALDQLQIETAAKLTAAKWIVKNIELKVGAGIFLDAGSSCLAVWHALRELEVAHLYVLTNNLLILNDYSQNLDVPWYRSVHMELFGSVFDAAHMAFYFYEQRDASRFQFVRPSLVCIGTAGVEFSSKAGILLGYHSGKPERSAKELWFQVPCSGARVILGSPSKIGRGRAGAFVIDVLRISDLDVGVPIYLVTAAPPPGSPEAPRFAEAVASLQDAQLQQSLVERGIDFSLIVVDPGRDGVPQIVQRVASARPL